MSEAPNSEELSQHWIGPIRAAVLETKHATKKELDLHMQLNSFRAQRIKNAITLKMQNLGPINLEKFMKGQQYVL